MKFTHGITGCFLYTCYFFFHVISVYASRNRETMACVPSPYQLVSCSHGLVTAGITLSASSNFVQRSASSSGPQKDVNVMAPDLDYWLGGGGGGAQSNRIWRLPPGFVDLCEGGHWRAGSTRLMDSCYAALTGNTVSVFAGV